MPIPGTRSVARLEENLGALKVALSPAGVERIGSALDAIEISGGRYPPEGMALVNR